jgi:hypothetical protein
MRKDKYMRNYLKEQMKEIFLNNQVNIGTENEQILENCAGFILSDSTKCIDSKDLELEDIDSYYNFQIWDEKMSLEKFEKNLTAKLEQKKYKVNYVKMVFLVKDIRQQVILDNKIVEIRDSVKKIINASLGIKIKSREIEFLTIFLNTEKAYNFQIAIDSRIKSLITNRTIEAKDDEKITIFGHVFIANLAHIVEIYNKLGNELFSYNIRYGIKDELNVDLEIKKTLRNNPEEFWYLNNGITMLIQDDEFAIKKSNCLDVNYGKGKVISVINGAQTLSTSAEFFYEEENTPEVKTKKENATQNAKVLLRIIHMNNVKVSQNQDICNQEIDKISLALNRQKPIQPEDVAFTTKFINKLNEIKDKIIDSEFSFTIKRRGDATKNGYTLVDFARATKAYLVQNPGKARSGAKREFLDVETNNDSYGFKDKNIFKEELIDEGTDSLGIFNKYYKPINLVMKLQEYYAKQSTSIKKQFSDEKHKAILNYGKWHFVAYVVFVLNNYNNVDFTNFKATMKAIDTKYIDTCIKEFINLFSQSIPNEIDKLDSNHFKNEDLYNRFRSYKDEFPNTELSLNINKFNEFIIMNFSDDDSDQTTNKQVAAALESDVNI